MKVLLTDSAKIRLAETVEYYRSLGFSKYARKTRTAILKKAMMLGHFPKMGQEETVLKPLGLGHRYIVVDKWKVVYRIFEDWVIITDIFATRQDPQKML